ncbi:hypothetical protein COU75_01005 [Candidatus Peregrinibacteria bacterium CG10_big_fil_rev_8_21_14_0_10_42_8]|nr:MAG: hypothetical protein COU75_01005 [Candidatus Peregrinibacteria bacterium CG10_big_fil_rev_8_21_14_0_10_42_8]
MNKDNVLKIFRDNKGRTGHPDEEGQFTELEILEGVLDESEIESIQQITEDDIWEMLDDVELSDEELAKKYPESNEFMPSTFPRLYNKKDNEVA